MSTIDHRPKKPRDHVREAFRLNHYSIRTEESSVSWITQYTLFHNTRPPNEMASAALDAMRAKQPRLNMDSRELGG